MSPAAAWKESKPNPLRSGPSQKRRREPESLLCFHRSAANKSEPKERWPTFSSFPSVGLCLWLWKVQWGFFITVQMCCLSLKDSSSGVTLLGTALRYLSTQIATQQHKALRYVDDSLMFEGNVQETWRKISGHTEVCGTATLGPWRTWETSVCSLPHHRLCHQWVCLEGKRKELHVVVAGGFFHSCYVQSFPSKRDLKVSLIFSLSCVVRGCHFLGETNQDDSQAVFFIFFILVTVYQIGWFLNVSKEVRHAGTKHSCVTRRRQLGRPSKRFSEDKLRFHTLSLFLLLCIFVFSNKPTK